MAEEQMRGSPEQVDQGCECDCEAAESPGMNRRSFLAAAAVAGVVSAVGLGGLPVLAAEGAAGSTVDAGPVESAAKDGIETKFVKTDKFMLVRVDKKLVAMSSECTHKRCAVQPQAKGADDPIFCKCHKSYFSIQGTPTGGPAKRSLPRYAISKNDKGHVVVDKSKQFAEKEWDDPASFISVE